MPDNSWSNINERNQRLGKIGMLELICHSKFNLPQWEYLEDMPFTDTLRNRSMEGFQLPNDLSHIFLYMSEIKIVTMYAKQDHLNTVFLYRPQSTKGQATTLNHWMCILIITDIIGRGLNSWLTLTDLHLG